MVDLKRSECIELWCRSFDETAKAIFCDFGDVRCWIPKSQIHDDSDVYEGDQEGEIIIPEWLAEEKGLI